MPQKPSKPARADALPFGGRSISLTGSAPPLPVPEEEKQIQERLVRVRAAYQRSIRLRRAEHRLAQRDAAADKR
jgi:hypothetical protein